MANHNFNITLAKKYGIEAAILIEHIYWWVHKNECEEVEGMEHDGRWWCRSTAKGFAKYIPYMKPDKIWRTLRKLEGSVLMVGNFNRQALNQTLWYTFTDKFIKELTSLDYDFENFKNANLKNKKSNNSIINNPIKENIIKEDIKKEDNKLSPKKSKFQKPTIEQIDDYIREMNLHFTADGFFDYYESKGWVIGKSPMKDWKAACRTWERNRKQQKEEDKEEPTEETTCAMDPKEWLGIVAWLQEKAYKLASVISSKMFVQMKAKAGDSNLLAEILIEIGHLAEYHKVDVMTEFERILKEKKL